MDFGDRVNWLIELSSPNEFKSAKTEFINHNIEGRVEKLDEEKGVIKGESRNPQTGKFEDYIISFDQHIVNHIKPYLDKPVAKIYKPIPTDSAKFQLENWISNLSVAKSYVDEESFYNKFPGYVSSLSKLIATLKDLKRRHSAPHSKIKHKEEKAYKLEPYLKIIQDAGSHDKAIEMLKAELSEFTWDRPHRKLFFADRDGINKSQVSHALELIAAKKWPDDYPSDETIRKALLK